MTAWPITEQNWARDAEGVVTTLESLSSFKAPEGKFLPIVIDLYNAQRMKLPIEGTLGPLLPSEVEAQDREMSRDSFVEACRLACEPLRGWYIDVKVGPAAGTRNFTRAIMLRAQVVDDKQQIVFEMDSTI